MNYVYKKKNHVKALGIYGKQDMLTFSVHLLIKQSQTVLTTHSGGGEKMYYGSFSL